jgi:DNA invertase Pin-like site-specific DNA recombinase
MRAIAYCRMSHASDNVKTQEADCRALIERRGWELAGVHVDDGTSAWQGSKPRPGYLAMLAGVEAGQVDALVIPNVDRLNRWADVAVKLAGALAGHHVLVAQTDGTDIQAWTADGRLNLLSQALAAEHQSARASERLRRKHRQLAEDGRWHGGMRAYGWTADHMTLVPAEVEIIRELARRVLAGETLRRLSAELFRRGVLTATGKPWRTETIMQTLRSAALSGQREHGGDRTHPGTLTPAVWPAILTPADTTRLRALFERGPRTPVRGSLLSGVIHCSLCGRPAYPTTVHRYRCSNPFPARDGGCPKLGINMDLADMAVTAWVVNMLDTPDLAAAMAGPADDADAAARQDLADALRARAEYGEDAAAGRLSRAAYIDVLGPLERRIEAAQRQVAAAVRLQPPPGAELGQLAARWDSLNLDQRRAVVRSVVDRVEILPVGKGHPRMRTPGLKIKGVYRVAAHREAASQVREALAPRG